MPAANRLLPVPMFMDNYLWLRINADNHVLAVDVGDYALLAKVLQEQQWRLATVFVTHHHADHVAGLPDLHRAHPGVPVYGPAGIEGVTHPLLGGEHLSLPDGEWQVMAVPGHTRDHLAYYQPSEELLFCGDTLFSGGCGRIFDGDADTLFRSLQSIRSLPDSTRLCCTHEYTLANLEFAVETDPGNIPLREYRQQCRQWREAGKPTLPAVLGQEKVLNPFLRCDDPALRRRLRELQPDLPENPSDSEVFCALRRYKDTWKPSKT